MTNPHGNLLLRVGLLEQRAVIAEVRAQPGQSITVGTDNPNTLCLSPAPGAPGQHVLFEWTDSGYHMQLSASMKGRFRAGGVMSVVEGDQPERARRLMPADIRGKIEVGTNVILFQFIRARPRLHAPRTGATPGRATSAAVRPQHRLDGSAPPTPAD